MMMSILLLTAALADDMKPADCPMHAQHMAQAAQGHDAAVDHNHDSFGFSHESSTHHFRVLEDGGAIELTAHDENDAKSIDAIRVHLRSVASDFTKNDFAKPLFVHGKLPDGVETMKAKSAAITYRYEELPRGGRVRILTNDATALDAIHRFLHFQTEEHRTKD
jgi:hypothetical protein